jgi:16S rRNA (guanine527-N7)-methyltransferase
LSLNQPTTTTDGDSLSAGLARHDIDLPVDQVELLDRYCRLLWDWNTKLNLTRHTDYEKFVSRDLVDSLVLADHLEAGERVLDVGTGGGVPGVVLAVCRPDLEISLCESVAKKARVVEQIVAELGLRVPVYHRRAEDLLAERTFDTLVIRAVAPLAKLLTWFNDRWGAFDRLLAVKGPHWPAERQEARERNLLKHLQLHKLHAWPLPGTDSESVLLEIRAKDL